MGNNRNVWQRCGAAIGGEKVAESCRFHEELRAKLTPWNAQRALDIDRPVGRDGPVTVLQASVGGLRNSYHSAHFGT